MKTLKRFDIVFDVEMLDDENDDNEKVIKVVTEKPFSDVVAFAESMIGKKENGVKITGLHKVVRYSDVEVI